MPVRILQQLLRGERLELRPADYLRPDPYSICAFPDLDRYVEFACSSAFGSLLRLSWEEPSSSGYIEAGRFEAGFSFLMIEAQISGDHTVTRHGDDCIVVQFFPRQTRVTDDGGAPAAVTTLPNCRLTRYRTGTAKTQRHCSPGRLSHFGIVFEPAALPAIVGIDEEGLPDCLRPLLAPQVAGDQIMEIPQSARLCSGIGALMNHPGRGSARVTCFYASLLGILVEVLDACRQRGKIHRGSYGLTARDEDLVQKARGLVMAGLGEKLTVEQIARRIGTNRTKLEYGFRLLFGQTVAGFVREARLGQALQRLRSGAVSIADLAQEIGYADATTFGRAFRRRYGTAPGKVGSERGT